MRSSAATGPLLVVGGVADRYRWRKDPGDEEWAKPAGTIFQNELQRLLTERLGVEWGPERNGTREITGFTREQLRRFSKRSVAIEAKLEAAGEEYLTPAERMRANDRASLATRRRKDTTLTPERLRSRWEREAHEVGIEPGTVARRLRQGRAGRGAGRGGGVRRPRRPRDGRVRS